MPWPSHSSMHPALPGCRRSRKTGVAGRIREYWAEDMVWQVPGHNRLSGWHYGLDQVLVTGEYSADLTRNRGHRAGQPDKTMDIEVVHVLHWRDGRVVAGKGAIFGDGTTEYDQFWSRSPNVTRATHSLEQPAGGESEAAQAAQAEQQWAD